MDSSRFEHRCAWGQGGMREEREGGSGPCSRALTITITFQHHNNNNTMQPLILMKETLPELLYARFILWPPY